MLLAAAGAGWLFLPQPTIGPALVAPRRDVWTLPVLPRRMLENSAVVIAATAPFWGVVVQPATTAAIAPPPEEPRWRIAAVFGDVIKRGVLIQYVTEVRPPLRLFVGDKLPGGYLITNIEEREICVLLGKKNYRLGVERIEP
jgi:hypothetical protein